MTSSNVFWTKQRCDQLRDLADAGKYPADIAAEMGTTIQSVVSKCTHLGIVLARRPRVYSERTIVLADANKGSPQAHKLPPSRIFDLVPREGEPEPLGNPGEIPKSGCRWVTGDTRSLEFRYCGHAVEYVSYCRLHAVRVYNPKALEKLPHHGQKL